MVDGWERVSTTESTEVHGKGIVMKKFDAYEILCGVQLLLVFACCVLIAVAGPLIAFGSILSGCKTTTLPDGTVVQQLDLDTAMAVYLAVSAERERLAAEDAREDAADEAARQERLAALERRLAPVRDWLLAQGAHFLQDEEGRWVSVRSGKVVNWE